MLALDILYIALATICVLAILQIFAFVATRVLYPPEPQIIYRNVPVPMPQQAPQQAPPQVQSPFLQQSLPQQPLFPKNEPTLTQQTQELKLPEYEPRQSTSDSLRVDTQLPSGLQTVNPRDLP